MSQRPHARDLSDLMHVLLDVVDDEMSKCTRSRLGTQHTTVVEVLIIYRKVHCTSAQQSVQISVISMIG